MTEQQPLVSIVIPCYNHSQFVQETIQSVIDQDYENIELIIIDDGSNDNSVEVIQEMIPACEERFVRFEFRCRPNRGLSATLNEALEWCEGKYFSGCASDDVLFECKVTLLVKKLEGLDESYAVAFGDAVFIDHIGNEFFIEKKFGKHTTVEKRTSRFLDYFTNDKGFDYRDEALFGSYRTLIAGNYLPAMSYVIKLDKVREVGAWTSGNTIEDWEMWLKLSKNYSFVFIDQPVAFYRWHESNTVNKKKLELLKDSMKLLMNEKEFALSFGCKKELYKSLVGVIIPLRHHDFYLFVKLFFENVKSPYFIFCFFSSVANRFFNK